MPVINSIEEIALTAGGGTKNLLTTSGVSLYIITGTATLTSSWTIQPSGTPVIGMTYSFLYKANIDLDTSDITIFGETLPTNLADKEFRAESVWNGTAWVTSFLPDISVSGVIPFEAVKNLLPNKRTLCIPVSFEAGEQGYTFFRLGPVAGAIYKVVEIRAIASKSIESTDDGLIVFRDGSNGAMLLSDGITDGFTATAGLHINSYNGMNSFIGTDTFDNNILTNTVLSIQTSKTTPGGKALLYITIEDLL